MQTPTGPWLLALLAKWAPIVAPVALVQPWLIALGKKAFLRGRIDLYEAAWIDVGFSTFGPTIGMMGTLRATHRDQFVRQIDLTVTRLKDGATHNFNWLGFRAEKVSTNRGSDVDFELASGFMVAPAQPHRYNIVFADSASQNEIRSQVQDLQAAWAPLQLAVLRGASEGNLLDHVAHIFQLPEHDRLPTLYDDFSNRPEHVQAFTAINRILYWEPGDYFIQMNVRTARPDRSFHKRWRVRFTADDFERLRLNTLQIIRGVLGLPVDFGFAYLRYLPE